MMSGYVSSLLVKASAFSIWRTAFGQSCKAPVSFARAGVQAELLRLGELINFGCGECEYLAHADEAHIGAGVGLTQGVWP